MKKTQIFVWHVRPSDVNVIAWIYPGFFVQGSMCLTFTN